LLLIDEARVRSLARLFGVGRQKSWLASAVAIGALAEALHEGAAHVFRLHGSPAADTMIGATVAKETIRGIAGARAKDTRFLATLVVFAVVAKSAGPAMEASVRGLETQAHRLRVAFGRRYGD
jgi:hypothetical protein